MMDDGEIYDDDDYRPSMSGEASSPQGNRGAVVATPESRRSGVSDGNPSRNNNNETNYSDPLEEAEAAAAAAEVAVMESGPNSGNARGNRGRDPVADRALMGATNNAGDGEDGVEAHEATDESGELVRGAFEEFLQN